VNNPGVENGRGIRSRDGRLTSICALFSGVRLCSGFRMKPGEGFLPAGFAEGANAGFFAGACDGVGRIDFRHRFGKKRRAGACGERVGSDAARSRTCTAPAGGFLFAFALADALPERISYTVGSELMRLKSLSLRGRGGGGERQRENTRRAGLGSLVLPRQTAERGKNCSEIPRFWPASHLSFASNFAP